MVLSITFVELGQAAMSSGAAWLTPICVRASLIDQVLALQIASMCCVSLAKVRCKIGPAQYYQSAIPKLASAS